MGYRLDPCYCAYLAHMTAGDRADFAQCAAGGIGIGWYISHNNTSINAPTAFGGSEGHADVSATATAGTAGATAASSFHVSPTFTVADRAYEPESTVVPLRRNHSHRRRLHEDVYY